MTEFPAFRSIEIARAKINLSLHVLGRRPDQYHELAGLMATLDLADRLDLSLGRPPERDRGWQVTADSDETPAGQANLCYKAASLFFTAAGLDPASLFFHCHIEKKIPPAAGFGGGSTDAAGVLRFLWTCWHQGLADFFQLNRAQLTMGDLEGLALACGADVPFCLHGGVRYCQGVGERMSEAIKSLPYPVLLAFPPLRVPTADAYRLLDAARLNQGSGHAPRRQTADSFPEWVGALGRDQRSRIGTMADNDFLEVQGQPGSPVRSIIDDMRSAGAFAASMTGSGSGCFGIFAQEKDLEHARRILAGKHPAVTWTMTALSPQPENLTGQN